MMKLPAARGLGRPHVRSLAVIPVTPASHIRFSNHPRFHLGGGTHAQPEGTRLQSHQL